MLQAGWFVEPMWNQALVIHMIRAPKLPFIQSHASAPVTLLTLTGIAALMAISFTPFGAALGFVALSVAYFAYLLPCILLYMALATRLKKPISAATASCCRRRRGEAIVSSVPATARKETLLSRFAYSTCIMIFMTNLSGLLSASSSSRYSS